MGEIGIKQRILCIAFTYIRTVEVFALKWYYTQKTIKRPLQEINTAKKHYSNEMFLFIASIIILFT